MNFKNLPAEGYAGPIPEYPQPTIHGNELHYWNWAWRTPQAALWSTAQWSWVLLTVADWCSAKAQAESPDAPVAIRGAIKALESKILLDYTELNRAGYTIAVDEVAERREAKPEPAAYDPRAEMAVINGGA